MLQEGGVGHVSVVFSVFRLVFSFAFVSTGTETGEGRTAGVERADFGMTAAGSWRRKRAVRRGFRCGTAQPFPVRRACSYPGSGANKPGERRSSPVIQPLFVLRLSGGAYSFSPVRLPPFRGRGWACRARFRSLP